MTSAAPFLFNTDFREDRRAKGPSEAEMGEIRAMAHAQGRAEGHAQACAEMDAQLVGIASQLLAQADVLTAGQEQHALALEDAAIALAVTIARRIAGEALSQRPMAEIEAAARQCIVHARTAPHLAIRVSEAMVEQVDALFARIARETGYAGKVVVLGEPDMPRTDARMEWADGGLVIDAGSRTAALDAALAATISQANDFSAPHMTESGTSHGNR
jgi:flagellar assembly protein FliH